MKAATGDQNPQEITDENNINIFLVYAALDSSIMTTRCKDNALWPNVFFRSRALLTLINQVSKETLYQSGKLQ